MYRNKEKEKIKKNMKCNEIYKYIFFCKKIRLWGIF